MRLIVRWCGVAAAMAFLALPAVVLAAPLEAPAEGRAAAKASTWHEFREHLLAYNRATMAGAYREVGTRGAWDADAVEFLDRLALYVTAQSLGNIYELKDVPAPAELVAAGKALIDAGCGDAMVRYGYGLALSEEGDPARGAEAVGHVRAAVLRMERYPPLRAWAAANRLRILDPSNETRALVEPILARCRLAMCRGDLDTPRRRIVYRMLADAFAAEDRAAQKAFLEELRKAPDADPWLLNVFEGGLETSLAWDSRGEGWADSVTPEGWRGFNEHLRRARTSLAAAHQLAPDAPEPCALMIPVAMGAGGELGEDTKTWFQRAEAAQLDYEDAYDRMFYALLPRWGGSYQQMFALGAHGMNSGRYDTTAPWQVVRAIQSISADHGRQGAAGWQSALRQPGVYDTVCEVADRYAAAESKRDAGRGAWYRTFRAAIAWRAERYKEARNVLEKVPDPLDPSAFELVGSQNPPAAVGHAYAMAGPHAAEVKSAEAAFQAREYERAAAGFRTVLAAKPEVEPRAAAYLDARLALLERRLQLARGEWIDVQPDAPLTRWTPDASGPAAWHVPEPGTLVGTNDGRITPSIICDETLGHAMEIAGTMEPLNPLRGGDALGGRPGVTLASGSQPTFFIGFAPGTAFLFSSNGFMKRIETPALADLKGPTEFTVRYAGGKLSASVGGKVVVDGYPVPPMMLADLHVGLNVNAAGAVRYTKLRVRRLTDPAAE